MSHPTGTDLHLLLREFLRDHRYDLMQRLQAAGCNVTRSNMRLSGMDVLIETPMGPRTLKLRITNDHWELEQHE